jgi:hypothetical protein
MLLEAFMKCGHVAAYSVACLVLVGCATAQLNYNTLDLADSEGVINDV